MFRKRDIHHLRNKINTYSDRAEKSLELRYSLRKIPMSDQRVTTSWVSENDDFGYWVSSYFLVSHSLKMQNVNLKQLIF